MKKLLTRLALLMILCAALALPVFARRGYGSPSQSASAILAGARTSTSKRRNSPGRSSTTGTRARSTRMRSIIPTATAAAGPIWPSPAASTSAICWTTRAWTSIPSPPSTFLPKIHSVGAYRSFTKYALLDQPRYYFPNLAGDAETGELYAWDGGDDLWVGAYQVEPDARARGLHRVGYRRL